MTRVWMFLSFSAALGVTVPAAAQGNPSCKAVNDALLKAIATPHHMLTTIGAQTSETIVVGDTTYTKRAGGAWKKSPIPLSFMVKQETENIKNAKAQTCQVLRSDTYKGDKVTVYRTHIVNESNTEDGLIFVSTSLGLPVRSEMAEEVGAGGPGGKVVLEWDYANIKAPIVK